MIKHRFDSGPLLSSLRRLSRQMPFILSKATNGVAFKVRSAQQDLMRETFDRPTPYIVRQVRVKKSSRRDLVAIVGSPEGVKGSGAGVLDKVLRPHIVSGPRLSKPVERRLVAAGIMPAGYYAVPASGARLNAYGGLSRSTWRRILAEARRGAGGVYFAARPSDPRSRHLAPGVYRRARGGITPIISFVTSTQYMSQLQWYERAEDVVRSSFDEEIRKAIDYVQK